jgi:diaminohydroxyphosphoribosylaminopyrimidine deaminase/5-amino-6-(5-phosphoribosylamino)uracil reductase
MTKGAANFMRECLLLALRGAGRVSPNPMVGALLVKGRKVVSWGWHHEFGGTHAEVDCLRRAHGGARGATLYVNLEPCSHHGKTPPCTEALIEAGIRHVVIAMRDPNPLVSGCGVKRLRGAGIEVVEGILKDEARFLNRFFCTHILSARPYVHVKVAESLDGRITGGNSRWITSLPSRRLVHRWRAMHDAVLVGAGTVLADRPSLTVRLVRGRDPHVVVLDGELRLGAEECRFAGRSRRRIILCTSSEAVRRHGARARALARAGVELLAFPSRRGVLDLDLVLAELYNTGIGSILVEGGAGVNARLSEAGLIDEFSSFIAPAIHGRGLGAFESVESRSPAPGGSRDREIASGLHRKPAFLSIEGRNPVSFRSPASASGKNKAVAMRTITVYNSGGDVLIRAFREKYRFTDLQLGS